ncbi:MAG: hypothetical protein JRF59_04025 [Deltaproteobacteria bacterium]|nr:hypothetical protein [Deltaproteobacteria bacterium]MBW1950597.1 hypothetical protein [Deltaproteobacteria bacterium]MBW2009488.1 hypothetical protein [Deltaproteobacteria bacterium]MBW2101477.1 hypothetical protein [Deltaproteobacteria bacterium]MBW2346996.1 hypothetical protein [Deltaproteobacteria bacterium]
MTKTYRHELQSEVRSISGWYEIVKEDRITHGEQEYLYLVGNGAVDSSCCGVGGCHYAVVPGAVVGWKSGRDEDGCPTSELDPVRDEEIRRALRELITKKEGVSQVQFW